MEQKKNVQLFAKQVMKDYFDAVYALIFFFPSFFSFLPLLKTLFVPWKHIVTKKEIRGFSFSEYFNRLLLNIISSLIGASMRLSIIGFCILFEIAYLLSLPLITLIYGVIVLLIRILLFLINPTDEELKAKQKMLFMASHCLKQENTIPAAQWFEDQWQKSEKKKRWWDSKILSSYPPLARDWATGYTPLLDEYVDNLTGVSYQADGRHIVGRSKELSSIQDVLNKSEEANLVLVGEEGVGKRTVVDALARLIYTGQIGGHLSYKRILKLNMEKVLTISTDSEKRQAFFESLLEEAIEAKGVILLIENIDKYCSSGEGRLDLTLSIEKYAQHPFLQFIGITTPFFYQRYLFPNEKVGRLFTKIDVREISKTEALAALLLCIPSYEQTYALSVPYETAQTIIEKCEFYITHIPFPEKAIELLDEAAAHYAQKKRTLLPEYIDIVLSAKTHIPTALTEEMRNKLLSLETLLGERVVFQQDAIQQLAGAIRRSFILLGKRKKPLATFLFLGPTGVGKTETAKALSSIFFGNDTTFLTRFDMSLYQSKDDIKTLIGSLESGLPGLLSQAVRQQPYAVLLLDELEKAHPDLLNIFLTLIDEGYFTDGFGRRVDCKNLMIIGTSNAGSDYIYKQQSVLNKISQTLVETQDFASLQKNNDMQSSLIDYLVQNKLYTPEFLNRFDGVVVYNPISDSALLELSRKMASSIQNTIQGLYQIKVTIKDETLLEIIKKHYNPAFGARNLEHIVTQEIEDKLATLLLEKRITEGQTVII